LKLKVKKAMDKLQLVRDRSKQRAIDIRKEKDGDIYKDVPDFKPGDTVIVGYRVTEGNKERIQNYKGIVIARQGSGNTESFTVRKISNGVGVERNFPIHSPNIQSIDVTNKGRVRRAKLFYLRGMSEKKIKQKLR
jgi:large subunit ribosomal protein L19